MIFELTPEQQAIADSVRRFTEREYDWDSRMRAIRGSEGRDPAHWAVFAELGWLGAGLPEEAGGFGGSAIENAVIAQELGKALVNEPFAVHVAAINLLASSPHAAIAEMIEPVMMGETRIAAAMHEAGARGDFRMIATRFDRNGDGFTISGAKSLVEGAASADLILVPAMGDGGLAVFAIPARANGVALRPYRLLDNSHVCDVTLDEVAVAGDALVAMGDEGELAFARAVDEALIALCAGALGTMEAALWATRDYLLTRTQFRVPLANFQVLQHRMADMLIEVEMTRSLLFHALGAAQAAMADGGIASVDASARAAAVSALKAQTGHAGLHVGREAIQMHGGIGVTEELAISHHYRRLFVINRLLGDEAVHLERFAKAVDGE